MNWETAQEVTVTCPNADTAGETVTLTSTDSDYGGIAIEVAVTVEDDTAQVMEVTVDSGAQLVVGWEAATGYRVQWKSVASPQQQPPRRLATSHTAWPTAPNTRVRAVRTVRRRRVRRRCRAPGVTLSKTALTVTEEDATGDSYTVVLDTLPTASVVVTVAGHSGTGVTPDTTTLTFTTVNWRRRRR